MRNGQNVGDLSSEFDGFIDLDSEWDRLLNRVEHLSFDRHFLDDLFPSISNMDFFPHIDRNFFNDRNDLILIESLELISDFDNSINKRYFFGENPLHLLDNRDDSFNRNFDRPVFVYGNFYGFYNSR